MCVQTVNFSRSNLCENVKFLVSVGESLVEERIMAKWSILDPFKTYFIWNHNPDVQICIDFLWHVTRVPAQSHLSIKQYFSILDL